MVTDVNSVERQQVNEKVEKALGLVGINKLKVSKIVVPVIPVYPPIAVEIVASATKATTGSQTVYSVRNDIKKDFYLTSATYSFVKDVACDIATGGMGLLCTINGLATSVLRVPVITLTAERDNIFMNFPVPIKIDRNTNIEMQATYTAGVMVRACTITGFYA